MRIADVVAALDLSLPILYTLERQVRTKLLMIQTPRPTEYFQPVAPACIG